MIYDDIFMVQEMTRYIKHCDDNKEAYEICFSYLTNPGSGLPLTFVSEEKSQWFTDNNIRCRWARWADDPGVVVMRSAYLSEEDFLVYKLKFKV